MYQQLYKYLILNRKIFFPGIGSFIVEDIPSSIDEITRIIKPAQQTIRFFNNGENYFNQSLFSFLAKENNRTEDESESKFNIFIAQLKNYLRSNDVVLPSLGTLKKYDSEGELTFIPHQKNLTHSLPLISLPEELQGNKLKTDLQGSKLKTEQVITKVEKIIAEPIDVQAEEIEIITEEEAIEITNKKDNWWMYAIALAVVAAGGLFYYYFYYNT